MFPSGYITARIEILMTNSYFLAQIHSIIKVISLQALSKNTPGEFDSVAWGEQGLMRKENSAEYNAVDSILKNSRDLSSGNQFLSGDLQDLHDPLGGQQLNKAII